MKIARHYRPICLGLSVLCLWAAPLSANGHDAAATSTGTSSSSGVTVASSTGGVSDNGTLNGGFGGTATTSGTVCIDGGFGCDGINVPEPSGAALLMLGLGLFAGSRIRRKRHGKI